MTEPEKKIHWLTQEERDAGEIAVLKADLTTMRDGLRRLIQKLEDMEPALNALCVFGALHGQPYNGPNWEAELKTAKELLLAVPER